MKLLEKIPLKVSVSLWGTVFSLLCAVLIWMIAHQYLIANEHNANLAADRNQRLLLSLKTGQVIPLTEQQKQLHDDTHQADKETSKKAKEDSGSEAEPQAQDQDVDKDVKKAETEAEATAKPEAEDTSAEADKQTAPPSSSKAIVKEAKVAILISGLGLSSSTTQRALDLPVEVSLGFSPYSYNIKDWVKKALKTKHDVLLELPMEPLNYPADDPGPYGLLTSISEKDNLNRLEWVLTRAEGFFGLYTNPGEKFSRAHKSIEPVLLSLQDKGIPLIHGNGVSDTGFSQLATKIDAAILPIDLVIDEQISSQHIEAQLEKIETYARDVGFAVAVGSPYPITIKMIKKWLPTLQAKGITLVPVSEIFHHQQQK